MTRDLRTRDGGGRRRRLAAAAALALALPLAACSALDVPVHGRIAVATEDGSQAPLAGVTVQLLPDLPALEHLQVRRAQMNSMMAATRGAVRQAEQSLAEAETRQVALVRSHARPESLRAIARELEGRRGDLDGVSRALESFASDDSLLAGMPAPARTAVTDANGEFVLRVPRFGDFVVSARAVRRTPDTTATYRWFMPLPADARRGTPLVLGRESAGISPILGMGAPAQ